MGSKGCMEGTITPSTIKNVFTGLVSDIYATLNATHSLRNISVEIHSMYTTNLALAIRSTNLEH